MWPRFSRPGAALKNRSSIFARRSRSGPTTPRRTTISAPRFKGWVGARKPSSTSAARSPWIRRMFRRKPIWKNSRSRPDLQVRREGTSMRRFIGVVVMAGTLAATLSAQRGAGPAAPTDPIAGAWRGMMRSSPETQTALVISIVKKGDDYSGVVNTGGTTETPIRKISLAGNRLVVETGADSKLGDIALTTDLMIDGNKATGAGTLSIALHRFPVTIELQRR